MPESFTDQQFSAALAKIVAEAGALGVSASVIQGGRKWVGVGGFRTLERQDPLDSHARFPIFSLTKTMMAVAALRLVDSGQLALDEDIADRIDQLPPGRRVSLRQLLNHISGIPDYGPVESYHQAVRRSPGIPWSFDDIMGCALSRPGPE